MKRKRQRLWLVVIGVLLLGSATALVFLALGDSVSLFRTPSQRRKPKLIDQSRRRRIAACA